MRVILLILLFIFGLGSVSLVAESDTGSDDPEMMVKTIIDEVKRTKSLLGKERLDPKVIQALSEVPRHLFVPSKYRHKSYENRPLPIGYGQTISQPYMVAVMTDLLAPKESDVVLEVGTGSGYQAAVLSKLVKKVYSLEIVEPLGLEAKARLHKLSYDNVEVRIADGYYGIPERAPFDKIIVTAASGQIPPPLVKQLKPGGLMVVPVGSPFYTQQLVLLKKDSEGNVTMRQIMPVRFVPLTRKK